MSKSPAELQAALPSSAHTQGGNASALGQLKAILSELDALRVERDGLEPKLETAKEKDDVLPLLLEKGSAAPEESVFEEQMLVYKPLKDAATAAIRKTEDAMARCKVNARK